MGYFNRYYQVLILISFAPCTASAGFTKVICGVLDLSLKGTGKLGLSVLKAGDKLLTIKCLLFSLNKQYIITLPAAHIFYLFWNRNQLNHTNMPFTGNEDHTITLATASQWTRNFRDTIDAAIDPTIGHYFSKSFIEDILAQQDCVGIRVYHALDEDGKRQLVIAGVKANEDDLEHGILAERALKSPPMQGVQNALNS